MALGNVHLTPQLVQAVRDTVDIVDIAGEYTKLRKAGRRHTGLCPLHREKTPSFSVDPDQGLFYCFGCGAGGDAIKLHMLLSGDDFPAAIESLARRYGIPLPARPARRPGEKHEPDPERALEAAAEFFASRLAKIAGPRDYLRRRKIPSSIVELYGLGFAPDAWRELIGALHPQVPMQELEAAGLVARSERKGGEPYDRFRNRLMFPIRNAAGRLVGFGGRSLGAQEKAKYLNTSETSRFRKGSLLYGLEVSKRAVREGGRVLLVEGYFDVLGVAAAGVDWVVASMGTSLTSEQARLLSRYADEVVVGYDGDTAGEEAYRRALPLLLAQGLAVKRLELAEGEDPDSLRFEQGDEVLSSRLEEAEDAVLRELRRLTPSRIHADPQQQARAARAVGELLRPIGDSVLRFSYGRKAADRLGVPVDLFMGRGAARGSAGSGGAERSSKEQLVRSVEERALQLLLLSQEPLPPAEDLPSPEAFFDPAARNIYQVFCDLYSSGDEGRPEARAITAALGSDSGAVDRLARLLLEGPVPSAGKELREALAQLDRRWQQQRLRRLAAQIDEAQRAGDRQRLERLLEEKTAASKTLHRRPTES